MKRRGYAFYEDKYAKKDGAWKIKSTKITTNFEEWDMIKR
jgi:hypothetical protein